MDLEEQLAGLCKKTRHRCWDWAQGLDSQLAHWKRLPAQRELDVCSLGGEASERGGGCSLSMTRKHCCLSQRGTESFLLISVGCISSFICWISDKKGKWEICIVPERAWGLSSWLKSSLDGLLLPVAQISPASPSRVRHSWWTARYLQPPAAPSVLTQSSLLKLLSEESAQFGDFTSPGYCWNPTVTLF